MDAKIKFAVFAICWNESKLMPHFLRHYRQASRLVLMDNESTDNSVEIFLKDYQDSMNNGQKRQVITFSTEQTLNDQTNIDMKNKTWTNFVDQDMDYIMIQDLDEFVSFPKHPHDILSGLAIFKKKSITCSYCTAYDMACSDEEFDLVTKNQFIIDVIKTGKRNKSQSPYETYDKVLIINPHQIQDTNFIPGQHRWFPKGNVILADDEDRPLLLHYKYIGEKWETERRKLFRERMSQENLSRRFGHQYSVSDEQINQFIQNGHKNIIDLTSIIFQL